MRTAGRDRQAKVEQLHELLVESVQAVQSSEEWKRLLDFAGRFHRYSFDNQCLIAAQHEQAVRAGRVADPVPTYVAGFRTWKSLGRSVDKGQRGYAILAPVASRTQFARGTDGATRVLGRGEEPAGGEELVRGPVALRGFTVAHVWDISQTSGQPVPMPPRPQLLEGGAPGGVADRLTAFIIARGFTVGFVPNAEALGGANGVTDFAARTVRVRADMDAAAQVKTLAHEAGHVLLHDPSANPAVTALRVGDRGRAEVEAESVAYVVTSACGMDPSGYSLPYVATWADTASPAEVVRATGRRVVGAAHEVLEALQVEFEGGLPSGEVLARERYPERTHSAGLWRASEAIGL